MLASTFVAAFAACMTPIGGEPPNRIYEPPEGGSPAGSDGGGGSDGGEPGGGGEIHAKTFHSIVVADDTERVTGVVCSGPGACAVSTGKLATMGHVYATDGKTLKGTLVTGDSDYAFTHGGVETQSGTPFWGFQRLGDRVILIHGTGEKIYTSATGDVSLAASWTSGNVGSPNGPSDFGLNKQYAFGYHDNHFRLISNARIWQSPAPPGASAVWTEIYAPAGTPMIPSDLTERRATDTTLCNSEPFGTGELNQLIYSQPDGPLVVMPANTASQRGSDKPGVCISTDGGHDFHHVLFPGREPEDGPYGVECTSKDHCVAYAGKDLGVSNPAIYFSNDVSKGSASTWTKATTPALADYTTFRHVAFAADGLHGWIVGWPRDPRPLLFKTTDGGKTWTDATDKIRALAPDVRLHTVYVYGSQTFVGGDRTLLATD